MTNLAQWDSASRSKYKELWACVLVIEYLLTCGGIRFNSQLTSTLPPPYHHLKKKKIFLGKAGVTNTSNSTTQEAGESVFKASQGYILREWFLKKKKKRKRYLESL